MSFFPNILFDHPLLYLISSQSIITFSKFTLFFFLSFPIPQPTSHTVELKIGTKSHYLNKDDFQVSYAPFLRLRRSDLLMERSAIETNRYGIHWWKINAVKCSEMQCSEMQCSEMQCSTIQSNVMQ